MATTNATRSYGPLSISALAAALAIAAGALAQTPPPAAPNQAPPPAPSAEVAARAAYLSKLPPFVHWPAAAFDSPAGPLNICLVGGDPFGPALDQIVDGQHVGPHPIAVKRLARFDKGSACQVLYLGALKGAATAEALSTARGAPVLTVTEGERADDPRGMIDLNTQGQRVRLVIDQKAARRNGLILSSKLLSLTASDRRRRRGGDG